MTAGTPWAGQQILTWELANSSASHIVFETDLRRDKPVSSVGVSFSRGNTDICRVSEVRPPPPAPPPLTLYGVLIRTPPLRHWRVDPGFALCACHHLQLKVAASVYYVAARSSSIWRRPDWNPAESCHFSAAEDLRIIMPHWKAPFPMVMRV